MADMEQYINEYGKAVYSYCVYLTGDRDASDDLYQQTFLTVFEKVKDGQEIDADRNPKSYLLTVATNLWNNQRRKYLWRRKKVDVDTFRDVSELEVPEEGLSVEDAAIKNEKLQEVRLAVQNLPDKYRVVILMFYMEELSLEDIASALALPTGTVKSRLHKAKGMLQNKLQDLR
ncbi:MAG: RNA polymerase sigma factor [Eubacterium sp.]|nr:RNA polymerase sigma factor [Eubacterium sp.]